MVTQVGSAAREEKLAVLRASVAPACCLGLGVPCTNPHGRPIRIVGQICFSHPAAHDMCPDIECERERAEQVVKGFTP